MSNPRISLVIPVYNVEPYLEQCLQSVLAQKAESFEALIVDDGSTDSSPQIIANFVQKYPDKFRSYAKTNGGLGDARNYGIMRSSGKYLAFLDSDDFLHPDALLSLENTAIQENSDIVVSGFYINNRKWSFYRATQLGHQEIYGSNLADSPEILVHSSPHAWNKLYARSLFIDNDIEYPSRQKFEDLATTYRLFAVAQKISKVNQPLMYYTEDRADSITNEIDTSTLQIFDSLEMNIKFYQSKGLFKTFKDELCLLSVRHIYLRFRELYTIENIEYSRRLYESAMIHLHIYYQGYLSNRYVRAYLKESYVRRHPALKLLKGDDAELARLLKLQKSRFRGTLYRSYFKAISEAKFAARKLTARARDMHLRLLNGGETS